MPEENDLLLSAIRLYLEDFHDGWSARAVFSSINVFYLRDCCYCDFYVLFNSDTISYYNREGVLETVRYNSADILSEISKAINLRERHE